MTEFFSMGPERPVRLTEKTRIFAKDSLDHRYGLDTQKVRAVSMDGEPGFESMSDIARYDAAVRRIALEAPVRICEGEMISGAATLGLAVEHTVPATYKGKALWSGVSHLTVDFAGVLKRGLRGVRADVEASLKTHSRPRETEFLKSCLSTLDSFEIWNRRYTDALREAGYSDNAAAMERVPLDPPRSFREALQSVWSVFAFLRLCGNWPGIGRLDAMLGGYLKRDLKSGVLTEDAARELVAHFFIKGCEWIRGGVRGSGDAQHYQNLVLAGTDENGLEVTNELTFLILDVIEELGIGDFPTTLRISPRTDPALLRRAAEVVRLGGGVLAFYNEDLVINALLKDGYPLREARSFANDGCWEVQVPGKTYFIYTPFDALKILQEKTLKMNGEGADFDSFGELYAAFVSDIRDKLEERYAHKTERLSKKDGEWSWAPDIPCTAVSLLEEGCIRRARSYLEGGPEYELYSPHIGGLADAVNSLSAIKKLVFDEKRLTLKEFISVLNADWEGAGDLRRLALSCPCYGNDDDFADSIYARLMADFAAGCRELNGRSPYRFPAGVSTFGRQLEWAPDRKATPFGRRAGEILAANCSPTPQTDLAGATAVIRSYAKADLSLIPNGAALDLKLLPDSLEGEDGISALVALMKGFVKLGGFFFQPDVEDPAILKRAQEDPERYQTLSVRVSGWNARFVTLNREWQDMVIAQNGGIPDEK